MQFIGSRRQIGGRRAPQMKSPFRFLVCPRLSLKIGVKPQPDISSLPVKNRTPIASSLLSLLLNSLAKSNSTTEINS